MFEFGSYKLFGMSMRCARFGNSDVWPSRRRTFYAEVTLFNRTFWLMWWAAAACKGKRAVVHSRDRLMCLTAGRR